MPHAKNAKVAKDGDRLLSGLIQECDCASLNMDSDGIKPGSFATFATFA